MKRAFAQTGGLARSVAPTILRLLRGRRARGVGILVGCALLGFGLWSALSHINFASVIGAVTPIRLVIGLGLAVLTATLGAMAWAAIVSAIAPGTRFGRSMIAFYAALPLKYLPGSVWNHLGKAAWLSQATWPTGGPNSSRGITSGVFGVALDLALLLWSGAVATILLGAWQVPTALSLLTQPATWYLGLAATGIISAAIPFVLRRLWWRQIKRAVIGFAARIWCAHLLQIAGWLCSSVLLGYIVVVMEPPGGTMPSSSDSMFALFAGMIAGLAVAVVPNGLGVREWVISLGYASSASAEISFAAGFVFRIFGMVAETVIFLVITVVSARSEPDSSALTHKGD